MVAGGGLASRVMRRCVDARYVQSGDGDCGGVGGLKGALSQAEVVRGKIKRKVNKMRGGMY